MKFQLKELHVIGKQAELVSLSCETSVLQGVAENYFEETLKEEHVWI